MRYIVILLAAVLFGCSAPQQPQQNNLLNETGEALVAHRSGLTWVLDEPVVDLANEVLLEASIDSVVFDSSSVTDEGDGLYSVQLYGTYNGVETVVDRMLCQISNDTLYTIDDPYTQAYYTLCSKVLCCAVCGKTAAGTCACATESCTGGICSTRTMAAYPANGVSNGIRDILTQ
jgi:hypothetical protein